MCPSMSASRGAYPVPGARVATSPRLPSGATDRASRAASPCHAIRNVVPSQATWGKARVGSAVRPIGNPSGSRTSPSAVTRAPYTPRASEGVRRIGPDNEEDLPLQAIVGVDWASGAVTTAMPAGSRTVPSSPRRVA